MDGKLAAWWPQILSRQDTYAANHGGRYWQGLASHTLEPADGTETAPDCLTKKPHYQAEDWSALGALPATWPMVMWFDQYKTPAGTYGFVGHVCVKLGTQVWQRSRNGRGPETWRTQAWQRIL